MGSYCLSCSRRFLFIFGHVAFIFLIGTLQMAKPIEIGKSGEAGPSKVVVKLIMTEESFLFFGFFRKKWPCCTSDDDAFGDADNDEANDEGDVDIASGHGGCSAGGPAAENIRFCPDKSRIGSCRSRCRGGCPCPTLDDILIVFYLSMCSLTSFVDTLYFVIQGSEQNPNPRNLEDL